MRLSKCPWLQVEVILKQPEVQCVHGTHQRSCVDTFSNSKQRLIAAV
jgi:hypothetical protein